MPGMIFTVLVFAFLFGLIFIWGKRRPVPALSGTFDLGSQPSLDQSTFTIGVYNIHRGRGTDRLKSLSRIVKVIVDSPADVVGLCECQGRPVWQGNDQCTELGAELGLTAIFSPTQKRWGYYDRGNGLLSRIPITKWQQEPLVDSTGTHSRSLLQANMTIGGLVVPVFVTHLARCTDQDAQLQIVIDRFSEYDRAILVGDLNLTQSHPMLAQFLAEECHIDAISVAGLDEPGRIDWIITKGFKVADGGHNLVGPSDHPYYWVRVEI